MKKTIFTILFGLLLMPAMAQEQNLLDNGDFEIAQENKGPFGTTVVFEDWEFGINGLAIETADVYHGKQAVKTISNSTGTLRQEVTGLREDEIGQAYELTIHYKVLKASENDIKLACEWSYEKDPKEHDVDVLTQTLPLSDAWKEMKIRTTKPEFGSSLHVGIRVEKKAQVLFDDFSLVRVSPATSLTEVNVDELLRNGEVEIYTLSGQRVDVLQSGVNIIRQGGKSYKVVR